MELFGTKLEGNRQAVMGLVTLHSLPEGRSTSSSGATFLALDLIEAGLTELANANSGPEVTLRVEKCGYDYHGYKALIDVHQEGDELFIIMDLQD